MWPVPELRDLLPKDLHAGEDTDFLVVRCRRCACVNDLLKWDHFEH